MGSLVNTAERAKGKLIFGGKKGKFYICFLVHQILITVLG